MVTVHVKGRVLKGETVPLGQGNTDFVTCFSMFKAQDYAGLFTLEVARAGNEIESARKNVGFAKNFLKDSGSR